MSKDTVPELPTLEDLIAIASKPKDKAKAVIPTVKDFIITFNLERGEYKIPRSFLHKIYLKWINASKGKMEFYREMEEYFESANPAKNTYYLMNKSQRDITKSTLYLIKQDDKETNKTQQDRLSWTRQKV